MHDSDHYDALRRMSKAFGSCDAEPDIFESPFELDDDWSPLTRVADGFDAGVLSTLPFEIRPRMIKMSPSQVTRLTPDIIARAISAQSDPDGSFGLYLFYQRYQSESKGASPVRGGKESSDDDVLYWLDDQPPSYVPYSSLTPEAVTRMIQSEAPCDRLLRLAQTEIEQGLAVDQSRRNWESTLERSDPSILKKSPNPVDDPYRGYRLSLDVSTPHTPSRQTTRLPRSTSTLTQSSLISSKSRPISSIAFVGLELDISTTSPGSSSPRPFSPHPSSPLARSSTPKRMATPSSPMSRSYWIPPPPALTPDRDDGDDTSTDYMFPIITPVFGEESDKSRRRRFNVVRPLSHGKGEYTWRNSLQKEAEKNMDDVSSAVVRRESFRRNRRSVASLPRFAFE